MNYLFLLIFQILVYVEFVKKFDINWFFLQYGFRAL